MSCETDSCDHEWFDAWGWLSESDQYCGKCFRPRDDEEWENEKADSEQENE
jgi:hypothetical protein